MVECMGSALRLEIPDRSRICPDQNEHNERSKLHGLETQMNARNLDMNARNFAHERNDSQVNALNSKF